MSWTEATEKQCCYVLLTLVIWLSCQLAILRWRMLSDVAGWGRKSSKNKNKIKLYVFTTFLYLFIYFAPKGTHCYLSYNFGFDNFMVQLLLLLNLAPFQVHNIIIIFDKHFLFSLWPNKRETETEKCWKIAASDY
jgi:hypothetical protein